MAHLIKAVFEDGEEMILEPRPLEEFVQHKEDPKNTVQKSRYKRQYINFAENVLRNMDYPIVEQFAKAEYYLINDDEAECHELHLETCKDKHLLEETRNRGLITTYRENIVNVHFASRFARIVEHSNPQEVEHWIGEMEMKYKIG